LLAGAVHLTTVCPLPDASVTAVGMPGAPIFVGLLGDDGGPVPFTLNAAT